MDEFVQRILEEEGGGFKLLGWEELNVDREKEREDSVYTEEQANRLQAAVLEVISPYLLEEGTENLLSIYLAGCGLCLEIPPVNEQGWVLINHLLQQELEEEDYLSLDWDLCYENGYTASPWD